MTARSDIAPEIAILSAESPVCKSCYTSGLFLPDHFKDALVTSLDNAGFTYTTTWQDIEKSARKTGCDWCSLLEIYRAAAIAKGRAETGVAVAADQRIHLRVCIEIRQLVDLPSPNKLRLYIDSVEIATFKVYTDEDDPAADYLGTEDPLHNMFPSIDWQLASQMINECSSHEFCPTPAAIQLPTRLIDCSDPSNPRLVITDKDTPGRYAALSYVWGGLQPRCLTTLTLEEYEQRIPSPLPQTIDDAISATHKIGVQYLWIDAFCILQDSESDKLLEISKMHGIYKSAYVTLTPEFAHSAREGFLPERRAAVRLPFYTPGAESRLGSMFVRHGLEVTAQWESRLLQLRAQASESLLAFEHIDTRAPAHTRAWCFQELTLSPRVLLFCYPEAYFRCRSATTSITQGAGYKLRPDMTGMHFLFPKETTPSSLPLPIDMRAGLQSLWHHIVLEYSERRMTLPEDKLVAIAAVAEAFNLAGAGDYIAGLWRQTLLEDLMWQMIHKSESKVQVEEYRAPSWSWASIDDQVHMSSLTDTQRNSISYKADIISCTVMLKSSINPFGAVSSGVLMLETKMEPVIWNPGRFCLFEDEGGVKDAAAAAEVRKNYFLLILAVGSMDDLRKSWIIGLFVLPTATDGTYRRVDQPYRSSHIPLWYEDAPRQIVTLV